MDKYFPPGARSRSQRLRSTVDDLLTTEHNTLQQSWADTNRAFQQRIADTQADMQAMSDNVWFYFAYYSVSSLDRLLKCGVGDASRRLL